MRVSEIVRQFITQHIDSVDQLEILLLLKRDPGREWTAEEISRTLFTQAEMAVSRLTALTNSGLLKEEKKEDKLVYRYYAQTADLEQAVNELARIYPMYRVTIINLIFSKPNEKIRTFADAFRIRKDEE